MLAQFGALLFTCYRKLVSEPSVLYSLTSCFNTMSAHFRALYYTHYLSLGFILVLMVLRIIVLFEVAIEYPSYGQQCHGYDHNYRIEQ